MQEDKTPTELYRHYDKAGTLLYVGISLSAVVRLGQHKTYSSWFSKIDTIKIEHHTSRRAALAAEKRAIKSERPKYNKTHGTHKTVQPKQLVERSREDLLRRIVYVKPIYTLYEVSTILGVSLTSIMQMAEDGDIGYIDLPKSRSNGREKRAITGWQLLEYIDHLHKESERKHGRLGRRRAADNSPVRNSPAVRKRRITRRSY